MKWKIMLSVILNANAIATLSPTVSRIIRRAKQDCIDLESQPWAGTAFNAIDELSSTPVSTPPSLLTAKRIDVHVHAVPSFYYDIMPVKPNQPWTVQRHIEHMADLNISHAVLSIPWPGASIYSGNETATIALARILNEYFAELIRVFPRRFSFMAVAPLPFGEVALREVKYALSELGAAGVGLFTNHDGRYLGNTTFQTFFSGLNALNRSNSKVILVHPAIPSCPSAVKSPAQVDFYWDSAETVMDLTYTQTLHNFTELKFIIAHGGGAFPSIIDRMFIHETAGFKLRSMEVYKARMWWDSAGPTYPRQIQGLLAYDIPKTQLLYGTDFPFDVGPYGENTRAVAEAPFLTHREKDGVFRTNSLALFGGLEK